MDERDLRDLLGYDSSHLHLPTVAELVATARRRRTRRTRLAAAATTAGLVAVAVLLLSSRGPAGPDSSGLAGPTAAPTSAGPTAPPAASLPVVTAGPAEAGAACRRALTARGVLRGGHGHNVVLGLGAAWLVQVWPDAPSDVPDGQRPPGPLWECSVGYGSNLSTPLVVSDVHTVPAPAAEDLSATDGYACSVVEHVLDDLR